MIDSKAKQRLTMKLIFGYLDFIHASPSRVYLRSTMTKQSQLCAKTADSGQVRTRPGLRHRWSQGSG